MKNNHFPKNTGVGYVHSATRNGVALAEQVRQIKAKAAQDGVRILKIYTDPAWSGTAKSRPGLQQLLQDAGKGQFRFVYVQDVTRLARRPDWSSDVLQELQKSEVTLRTISLDLATPEGKLTLHILEALGKLYAANFKR